MNKRALKLSQSNCNIGYSSHIELNFTWALVAILNLISHWHQIINSDEEYLKNISAKFFSSIRRYVLEKNMLLYKDGDGDNKDDS